MPLCDAVSSVGAVASCSLVPWGGAHTHAHFIRKQMEKDIAAGMFVQHGMHDGHYYATR